LADVNPTYFANGGDRTNVNTPEMSVCKKYGIEMLWNIGGGKIQSSSDLVEKAREEQ
jgi:D-beta-D-heptose 7-phosphate kinase/D-beta-D-heptose 1-phosphate adenosyltransferase